MNKIIIIEQVSNGYIVREDNGQGYIPKTLAVFNNVGDMSAFVEEHFKLPSKEGDEA